MMSLAQAVKALSAGGHACRLEAGAARDAQIVFDTVSIDTRTLAAGALYIALRGERFDGHAFAAAARDRGAVALMVEQLAADAALHGVPQIVVPDTYDALGRLAAAWRTRFAFPVIAVAGSNGKTTTTQMIAAILAAAFGNQHRAPAGDRSGPHAGARQGSPAMDPRGEHASDPAGTRVGAPAWFATRGNRNNEIGVPLMLLELRAGHRAAVLELGMNHPGEMRRLSQWVRPDVALVTNAQREHQEFLDSVAATARENAAVIDALGPGGTAVFPADDDCAAIWRAAAGSRPVVDFALDAPAAVSGRAQLGAGHCKLHLDTPAGAIAIALQVGGLHNARNALAAAAACIAAGIPLAAVAEGLAAFTPVAGRGTRRRAGAALFIDETYNANPDSVRAAIDLLAGQEGLRVLVLGDMGEVGVRGPQFHREVGDHARARGIERLLALGEQSAQAVAAFGAGGEHFAGIEALIAAVHATVDAAVHAADMPSAAPAVTVLVKGSRFMRLERVIAALAPAVAPAAGPPTEHHA